MSNYQILKRLYFDYTQKYLKSILTSVFFTILLAGSTSAVAYLLDPAIKELFIEQNKDFNLCNSRFDCISFHCQRWFSLSCKNNHDKCFSRSEEKMFRWICLNRC